LKRVGGLRLGKFSGALLVSHSQPEVYFPSSSDEGSSSVCPLAGEKVTKAFSLIS